MPRGDGTGPSGKGPMTGQGRGICGMLLNKGRSPGALRSVIGTLTIAVGGLVVRDIANPRGVIQKIANRIKRHITGGSSRPQIGGTETPVQTGIRHMPERTQHE